MPNLRWDGNDFRNSQDGSGSTADLVSHSGKLQQGYKHGSLTRGLVAYYPMEKGEGEVLHDGALNNLAQIKGASWTTGEPYSNTLSFNGSSDEVLANTQGMKSIADNAFTVVAWVYPTAFDGRQDIINTHSGSGGFNLETEGPSATDGVLDVIIQYSDGTNSHVKSNSAINLNEWTMVAFTLDNDNQPEFFLNGSSDGAGAGKSTIESKPDDIAETSYVGSSGGATYFTGKIGEIRAYDRVLSQPEIQALYNLTKPSGIEKTESDVPSQNQGGISRYKFEGDVTDSWGNNDGTNNGVKFTDGVYGQAGSFNGSDDWIDTADNDYSYISAFVWVKTSTGGGHILNKDNWHDSERSWAISANDGYQKAYVSVGGTNYEANFPAFQDGNWHHIGFTYNGNKLILYEDGSQVNSNNSPSGKIDTSNLTIKIGAYGNTPNADNYYDGLLDDVRIYNTALTPQQVEQLYNLGAYRIPRRSTLQ